MQPSRTSHCKYSSCSWKDASDSSMSSIVDSNSYRRVSGKFAHALVAHVFVCG